MSGRAMDGESQRGLKKMKPLSLAPLSLGGDQLEPGDAMIDAMIDKLLHFGADASASPAGARAGARPKRAAPLARAQVTPRAAGRFGLARAGGAAISQRDVAALLRAAKAAFLAEPAPARESAREFRHRVGAARVGLERARAPLSAPRAIAAAPRRARRRARRPMLLEIAAPAAAGAARG